MTTTFPTSASPGRRPTIAPLQSLRSEGNTPPPFWTGRIAITGVGLVTPVGLNAPASCAALCARVSRIAELPDFLLPNPDGDPIPVTGGTCPASVTCNRQGPSRLARLANHALAESLNDSRFPRLQRCSLYLGLPAPHPAARVLSYGESVAKDLRQALTGFVESTDLRLFETGRASVLHALHQACLDLSLAPAGQTNGPAPIAIVGGVDSWISLRSLQYLLETGRLRDGDKSTGILPGEAAGFLILERPDHALRRRANIRAHLTAAATAYDPTPLSKPNRAAALAGCFQAIAPAVGPTTPTSPLLIISDLNGERHRAYEWMFASIRSTFHHTGMPHWRGRRHRRHRRGSGAVSAVWAATAFSKSYAPAPKCVLWGSSDEGNRHCLVLEKP